MSMLLRVYKNELNLFIVLALLINAFAPLSVAFSNPAAENTNQLEQLFGEKVIICTPFGYKYISLDELQDNQNSSDNEQVLHCAFCSISMTSVIIPMPDKAEFYHVISKSYAPNIIETDISFINSEATNTLAPRAPPVFS